MAHNHFYVDSCIYLNLWHKEGNEKLGTPYWKIAQMFFEKFDNEGSLFYYSGFLLKEMEFILTKEEFSKKRALFEDSPNFRKIEISKNDITEARKIESELNFSISFYDIIHIILARRSGSVLITRDKKLLEAANKYHINAKKPEELL